MEKKFLTYDQQIEKLQNEKQLTISDVPTEYSGRFWTTIPVMQYRCSVFNDTEIPGSGYRDSGQMIPIRFIMNSYALQRKFITKEVTIYDQVSWDHPACRIESQPNQHCP